MPQFTVTPNEVSKKRDNTVGDSKHRLECDADDLLHAIALSVETKRLEDERQRSLNQTRAIPDTSADQKAAKRSEPRTPLKKLLESRELDALPVKQTAESNVNFKYVGSPVRKQAERKKLPAFDCTDCRKYYAGTNLNEEQLQELLQKCSRHRSASNLLSNFVD